jgi:hypothetical protein
MEKIRFISDMRTISGTTYLLVPKKIVEAHNLDAVEYVKVEIEAVFKDGDEV